MTTNLLLIALFVFCMILMSLNLSKRKKKIVFFGDNVNELDMRPGGYISWFIDAMKDVGEEDEYQILQSVKTGEKIYDLYQRLDESILLKDVHTVIIHAGVQDVPDKDEKSTGTDLETFKHLYQTIIQKLINRNIRVVLCLPSPLLKTSFSQDMILEMELYREEIRLISEAYELPFVDLERIRLANMNEMAGERNRSDNNVNRAIGITLWKIFKGLK
ncbi:MAG: hypothetical protein LH478_01285 [Chitinophagaceae bacterium]|nr:hypothetical protein [Chitinophagaceae bacterium]